jgi:phospholipase D1/2
VAESVRRAPFLLPCTSGMRCGPVCLLRVAAAIALVGLLVAAWRWMPIATLDAREVSAWLSPHRHAWYALPAVMLAFTVMGLGLLPVVLLIAATGVAFGPLLGPIYAMAGCLASASAGFAIGRWMGRQRVGQLGGERIARLTRGVKRNGTLAVFLVRKVPAPFTLVNIVIGASSIAYRDFLIGTLLGMCAIVIALAGFGYQLTEVWRNPSPRSLLTAATFVAVPLTIAWLINRALRPAEPMA